MIRFRRAVRALVEFLISLVCHWDSPQSPSYRVLILKHVVTGLAMSIRGNTAYDIASQLSPRGNCSGELRTFFYLWIKDMAWVILVYSPIDQLFYILAKRYHGLNFDPLSIWNIRMYHAVLYTVGDQCSNFPRGILSIIIAVFCPYSEIYSVRSRKVDFDVSSSDDDDGAEAASLRRQWCIFPDLGDKCDYSIQLVADMVYYWSIVLVAILLLALRSPRNRFIFVSNIAPGG